MEEQFWRELVIKKFEKVNEKLDAQHNEYDIMKGTVIRIDQYLKDKESEELKETTSNKTKIFGIISSIGVVIASLAVVLSL